VALRLVVVVVAAIGNRVAGAIAAVAAAVWVDFLPYERFTIRSSADVTTFALLLAVGGAVSQLAACARRLNVVAITDAGYLAPIRETASLSQTTRIPDAVVDHVREQLIGLLDLQECRFEHGAQLGHLPRLDRTARCWLVMAAGTWRKRAAQRGGKLQTFGNDPYYGRFMLTPEPGSRPSLQVRLVPITLADQAGRALAAGTPTCRPHRDASSSSRWRPACSIPDGRPALAHSP
jgi:hypothetical protein